MKLFIFLCFFILTNCQRNNINKNVSGTYEIIKGKWQINEDTIISLSSDENEIKFNKYFNEINFKIKFKSISKAGIILYFQDNEIYFEISIEDKAIYLWRREKNNYKNIKTYSIIVIPEKEYDIKIKKSSFVLIFNFEEEEIFRIKKIEEIRKIGFKALDKDIEINLK